MKHKALCQSRLIWNDDLDENGELRKDHQPLPCDCGADGREATPQKWVVLPAEAPHADH